MTKAYKCTNQTSTGSIIAQPISYNIKYEVGNHSVSEFGITLGRIPVKMDWIFSYNTKYYDLHEAIHELEYIDWSTTNTVTRGKVEVGDRVYLYSVKPEMMVNYRCKVIAADKPYSTNEREVEFGGTPAGTPGPWAALQLECEFEGISYEDMRKHGLKPGVIVQRRVEGELQEYLEKMVDHSLKGSNTTAKNCWLLSASGTASSSARS